MEGTSVEDSWSFRLVGFERGLGLGTTTTFTTKTQRHKDD
jgi:hypothetical protein